jgi:hypothetical protein
VVGLFSAVGAMICAGLFAGGLMSTSSSSGNERRYPSPVVAVGLWRSSGIADDRRGSAPSIVMPGALLSQPETGVESALSYPREVVVAGVVVVPGVEVGLWLASWWLGFVGLGLFASLLFPLVNSLPGCLSGVDGCALGSTFDCGCCRSGSIVSTRGVRRFGNLSGKADVVRWA